MITIQQLLNRIRWDPLFGKGEFQIGYYDRVEQRIYKVPLNQVYLTQGDHFFFHVANRGGVIHEVPFHRVKEVYKDGELIWKGNIREHWGTLGNSRNEQLRNCRLQLEPRDR